MITYATTLLAAMADKNYDQEYLNTLTDAVLSASTIAIDMDNTVEIKPYEELFTDNSNYFTVMNFMHSVFPDQDDLYTVMLANNANISKGLNIISQLVKDLHTKLGVHEFLVFRSVILKDFARTDVKQRLRDETDARIAYNAYNTDNPEVDQFYVTYKDVRHNISQLKHDVDTWLNNVNHTDKKCAIIIPDIDATLSGNPAYTKGFIDLYTSSGCIVVNHNVTFINPESTKPMDKGYGLVI